MSWGDVWHSVTGGRARRLVEVKPVDLGVHDPPSVAWLERPSDLDVDAAVGGDGAVVVVTGPALSGKSHTLARAARRLLGEHVVVRPRDAHRDVLADVVRRASSPAVVWLDDAPPALLDQITPELVAGLPSGVRIFVTASDRRFPTLYSDPGTSALLTATGTHVRLPALEPVGSFDPLAGIRPALEEIRAALDPRAPRRWEPDSPVRTEQAVVKASVDLVRVGWPGPFPADRLVDAARAEAGFLQDPAAALVPLRRRRWAGLPVLRWTGRAEAARPRAHPLAVAVAEEGGRSSWTPGGWWLLEAKRLSTEQRHLVGRTAMVRDATGLAAYLLRDAEVSGIPTSVALELGRYPVAGPPARRRWYARALADETLVTQAHLGLGALEEDEGNLVEAYDHYLDVASDPAALPALARLAEEREDLARARDWHREVLERGDPGDRVDAARALARLAAAEGDAEAARAWYERAVSESGRDPGALLDWIDWERRQGEYARVRTLVTRDVGRGSEVVQLLGAAADLLDGRADEARRALAHSGGAGALLRVLLDDRDTAPAAEVLARSPDLLTVEARVSYTLVSAIEADRASSNSEAREKYRMVIDELDPPPAVAGIARYCLARKNLLIDTWDARSLHAEMMASPVEGVRALGQRFWDDFGWSIENLIRH